MTRPSTSTFELSPKRRALLEMLLREEGVASSRRHEIPRRKAGDIVPLSFAQSRLWFLDQLDPNSALYNITKAVRLSGPLNVEALEKTFDAVVSRHEVLRTNFADVDGVPVQIIAEGWPVALRVTDLSRMSASEREAGVQRLLKEEASRPFNLSSDLMLRATLLKLESEEHILLLVMHHIVSDGWSMGILFGEISALYEAFSTRKPSPLADLPIQYADFAIWQRRWLQGAVLESRLSYWRQQLKDAPHLLELPADRPRPAVQSYRGKRQSFLLPKALSEALKALSRQEAATLFMTLLAAFKTLLHRHTGQDDIVVGSPIAGRSRVETEGLVGFFVNNLVLRTDLAGDPSFREMLGRVRETALGADGHQGLPFEKLVEELQPERALSYNPLFQVVFALQNFPTQALRLSGLAVSPVEIENNMAKFDLTLAMVEKEGKLDGSFEYSTDLFDETTIKRMIGHFQTLLEGVVANPDQRLSDLPILTEAEKHQLLVEWNDTKREYPKDKCIHELFEAQAARTPDAVAVIFEDRQLTYRELNERANQLAHYLKKLGVGPEVLVGICLERSVELVIGLVAVLKAGGAYVPLDPTHPKERLAFMLQDSQAAVLLTEERLLDRLPELTAQVVYMDKEKARELESNPDSLVGEDNCAYVIYTSGSTGNPKGAVIEHRSLVNYLRWFNESPMAEGLESLPAITSATFDASLKQLLAPLLRGNPVWIVSSDVISDPAALLKTLSTRTSVGLNCVPSLWESVLKALAADHAIDSEKNLAFLYLGGEPLNRQLIDKTLAVYPRIKIWNLYGPTEATANASVARISAGTPITLGRPIANAQIYILDRSLQPVPIGVPGELHIGGRGLARGYLDRRDLTAEKFIPDPFSDEPGARLYKTGDLARFLPDGNIEFLGRVDRQVKIRGFRIELEEIETVLSQCPGVQSSVVVAREDRPGERQLAAYIIPEKKPAPTISELRAFLRQKVPEHMIPSGFTYLESLPLTPTGKLDRRALPQPGTARLEPGSIFVAPRNHAEEVLAGIWADVLDLDQVGIHDNFFDLGGHSLLGTKLIAQIQKDFQIDLPLRFLFESPTIAGLAARIGPKQDRDSHRQEDKKTYSYLVELQSGEGKKPVFFFPGGGGSESEFFIYARLARYVGPDYPFYGLRARGADGVSQPHGSVEEMAADYIKEIQTLQPQGPYFLVGECIGGVVAYEAARQLEAMGQKVAVLALMDTKLLTMSEYLRLRMDKFLERKSTSWEENPIWARIIFHSKQLRQLDSRQRVHYVFDKARRAVPAVLVEILLKILSRQAANMNGSNGKRQLSAHLERARTAYMRSLRRYKPRPYGDRIHILVSEKLHARNPTLGWDKLALKGLDIHKLPGDHLAYIREHVETTARQLRECLDQALADD